MSVDLLHYPSHNNFWTHADEGKEPEILRAKEALFIRGGPDTAMTVADFDYTLTENGPKDLSSWDVGTPFLTAESRAKDHAMYEYYGAKEKDGTLTPEEANTWWDENLKLYRADKVRMDKMRGRALVKIKFREHVQEYVEFSEEKQMPFAIVSAGLKFVIEDVARFNNIRPTHIISTDVKTADPETDKSGPITSWENVVHNHNKAEKSHEHLAGVLALRPNVILMGDSLQDANMIEDVDPVTGQERNVIRLRVGSHQNLQGKSVDEYRKQSFKAGYDIVTLADMIHVLEYVKHLVTPQRNA